jgi:Putative adhesin
MIRIPASAGLFALLCAAALSAPGPAHAGASTSAAAADGSGGASAATPAAPASPSSAARPARSASRSSDADGFEELDGDFDRLGRELGRAGEQLGRELGRAGEQLGRELGRELGDDFRRDLDQRVRREVKDSRLASGDHRRSRSHDDDGDDDENDDERRPADARATGSGTATLAVKGAVRLRQAAKSGGIEVVGSDRLQVSATLTHAHGHDADLALVQHGDYVDVEFGGRRTLRSGHLRVELPRGSQVELTSMSGDVTVLSISGEVRVRTLSGEVRVSGSGAAVVQSVSGDVSIEYASGPVKLHTVSGDARISSTEAAPTLEYQSTSGKLDWSGTCAKGCHLGAETVSGNARLHLDAKSSFELSYSSHSGDLRDELQLEVKRHQRRQRSGRGGWMEASFGKGEGLIECDTFSGDLELVRR